MADTYERFIKKILTYGDIPHEPLAKVQSMIRSESIEKDAYFIRMEEEPRQFAFINEGIFRVLCVSESGNEKTLAFRSEGQFIAPYTPVISNQPVWYDIQALTDCQIYYITVDQYRQLSKDYVCFEVLEKNYIVSLFLEKEERERSLLMDSAKVRYEQFITSYPDLAKRVQQNYIASYLGITPVSLSRLKSQ